MAVDIRQTYGADALLRRIPDDRADLFVGFTPWSADCEGWRRSVRESLSDASRRPTFRTVWDSPENRDTRVLIDVTECSSAGEAIEALLDRLAENQLAKLPEGPGGLGLAAFVHPEGAPAAVFFARGNLCLSVVSFGRRDVPVTPWAQRLDRRLDERPSSERAVLSLDADRRTARVGHEVAIVYFLPWKLGEDGYLKFFASGGTMARREDRLIFTGTRPGEARLEAFAVEPGREPYAGSLLITVG